MLIAKTKNMEEMTRGCNIPMEYYDKKEKIFINEPGFYNRILQSKI